MFFQVCAEKALFWPFPAGAEGCDRLARLRMAGSPK